MALSKSVQEKLNTRKNEFEFNQDALNQKLAYATMTYHKGLPTLGTGTTTHAREILVFKDVTSMLNELRTNYKQYEIDTQYTRARDNVFKVALIKPEPQQDRELEKIEADIKRAYKQSLTETKEIVINEILEEVAAEKFAAEEQKRLDKLDKEESELRKALLSAV